jgi:uncharacterized membrane protein
LGALVGGGVGLVIALFTGPGMILAGAGVGALGAKLRDSGFDDSQLKAWARISRRERQRLSASSRSRR